MCHLAYISVSLSSDDVVSPTFRVCEAGGIGDPHHLQMIEILNFGSVSKHFYICFIPTSRLALVCHRLGRKTTAQRRTLLWREKNVDGRERRVVIRKDTPELVIFLRLENNNFLLLL